MTGRIVRLLEPPRVLSSRQRAQKKYQTSAKGKAAMARYREKMKQDPVWRATQVARAVRWARNHRPQKRAYHRVLQRTLKRLRAARPVS